MNFTGCGEIRARRLQSTVGESWTHPTSSNFYFYLYSTAWTVKCISPMKWKQCSLISWQLRYRKFGQQRAWVFKPDVMQWFSTSSKVKSSLPLKRSLCSLLNTVCGTERAGDYCFTTKSNIFALFIKYSGSNQEKMTQFAIQLGP